MAVEKSETEHELPIGVRTRLVHGYVQLVAQECGADLLHIKGPAVHPSITIEERRSQDVDVLVRPDHVDRLIKALFARGWERMTGFSEGSAFGHAMNLRHDVGLIDLHRSWPGFEIPPESAFDRLWSRREEMSIAGVACMVPSVPDQRLILLLHFARSGGARAEDKDATWSTVSEAERQGVRVLAREFNSDLALAAATGELESFRDHRSYHLWRYFSRGQGSRFEEWHGRFSAAQGVRAKRAVLQGFLRVNHDLLAFELGRDPLFRDYRRAYAARVGTAIQDLAAMVSSAWKRRS